MRLADNRTEILVVRAKQHPDHWIFPKGHIEERESSKEAAVRELAEEAGVKGSAVSAVGDLEFSLNDDDVRVEYFLVKYQREVSRDEDREIRWCSYARALELLTFPDTRALLREARPRIEQVLGSPLT